jgi:hypothetical protein
LIRKHSISDSVSDTGWAVEVFKRCFSRFTRKRQYTNVDEFDEDVREIADAVSMKFNIDHRSSNAFDRRVRWTTSRKRRQIETGKSVPTETSISIRQLRERGELERAVREEAARAQQLKEQEDRVRELREQADREEADRVRQLREQGERRKKRLEKEAERKTKRLERQAERNKRMEEKHSAPSEHLLQDEIRRIIDQIEPDLKVIDGDKEHEVSTGWTDILCEGDDGSTVVIELKKGKARDRDVGQILRYMGELKEDLRIVRGIIIANDFHEGVMMARKLIPDVRLLRYERTVLPEQEASYQFIEV